MEKTVKHNVLTILSDKLPHTFKDIAEAEGASRASINKYLKDLIKDGLIRKGVDDADLRVKYWITKDGLDEIGRSTCIKQHLSDLQKLSNKELAERLYRYQRIDRILELQRTLTAEEMVSALIELKKKGDEKTRRQATAKLKAGYNIWFEKEKKEKEA